MELLTKICPKCENYLQISCFYKNYRTPDGFAYTCKACMSQYSKLYKAKTADRNANNKKRWYQSNKLSVTAYNAEYYKQNQDRIVDRCVNYNKNRLRTDPVFRLRKNIRHRIAKTLKQKSSQSISSLVGCSLDELKLHIESQFQADMSWDNYGKWHVDHIVPLANFDLSNHEELRKAAHYSNLQPLWATDNLKKNRY